MHRLITQPTAAVSNRLKIWQGIRFAVAVFTVVTLMAVCTPSLGTRIVLGQMAETSTPTPAPGTRNNDGHGIAQVYVPAGCFMMGSADQQVAKLNEQYNTNWFKNEQPQHQVCITEGYWLDAYEVTNAAYQPFINAGGYTTRDYWSDAGWQWKESNNITVPNNDGEFTGSQQPRVGVSWYEAEAYAKWRGGRLPTEAEWEYAARGPDSLIYPWGNAWDSSKANTIENSSYTTKPVGSYESGKSWVGAYDLAGNAWEWVADWYSDTYYQQQVRDNPAGPHSGKYRVARGGSWGNDLVVARAAFRLNAPADNRVSYLGIRILCVCP